MSRLCRILLTIASAPVDLVEDVIRVRNEREVRRGGDAWREKPTYIDVNHYHLETTFDGELLEIFRKIVDALNAIKLGRWNKPFVVTK